MSDLTSKIMPIDFKNTKKQNAFKGFFDIYDSELRMSALVMFMICEDKNDWKFTKQELINANSFSCQTTPLIVKGIIEYLGNGIYTFAPDTINKMYQNSTS